MTALARLVRHPDGRRSRERRAGELLRRIEEPWHLAAFHAVAELCSARVPLLRLVPLRPIFGSHTVLLQFANGCDIVVFGPLPAGIEELACCLPATAVPYHCSRPGEPFLVCFESPRGLILLTCKDLMLNNAPGESGNPVVRVDHVCPA